MFHLLQTSYLEHRGRTETSQRTNMKTSRGQRQVTLRQKTLKLDIVGTFVFNRKRSLLHVKFSLVTPFLRLKCYEFDSVRMLYFVYFLLII